MRGTIEVVLSQITIMKIAAINASVGGETKWGLVDGVRGSTLVDDEWN